MSLKHWNKTLGYWKLKYWRIAQCPPIYSLFSVAGYYRTRSIPIQLSRVYAFLSRNLSARKLELIKKDRNTFKNFKWRLQLTTTFNHLNFCDRFYTTNPQQNARLKPLYINKKWGSNLQHQRQYFAFKNWTIEIFKQLFLFFFYPFYFGAQKGFSLYSQRLINISTTLNFSIGWVIDGAFFKVTRRRLADLSLSWVRWRHKDTSKLTDIFCCYQIEFLIRLRLCAWLLRIYSRAPEHFCYCFPSPKRLSPH